MARVTGAVKIRDVSPLGDKPTIMAVYLCDYCKRFSIAWHVPQVDDYSSDNDAYMERMEPFLTWVPHARPPQTYPDVPKYIASAAIEAHECMAIGAHRAAVQLARSVIEATAKAKGIKRGNLEDKVDKLHEQGFVRDHIKDAAHEVRHLGNEMAHGDFVVPTPPEEADEVLNLMSEVLDEVFQSPARVERLRKAREEKKKQQAVSES